MWMKNHSPLNFLLGAGAGVLATYLLDPDKGEARRAALTDVALDTLDRAGHVLGDTVDTVTDSAKHTGRATASLAAGLAGSASDTGHELLHRGRKQTRQSLSYLQQLAGYEKPSLYSRATTGASNLAHAGRDHLPSAPIVGSSAATLVLGAGLYYFFGSSKGPERRAALARQVHRMAKETGEMGRKTGDYLRDHIGASLAADRTVGENPSSMPTSPTPFSGGLGIDQNTAQTTPPTTQASA